MRTHRPSRRVFVKDFSLGVAALTLPRVLRSAARAADGERPNILFAISDDQSWAHAASYGVARGVETPAFDQVASAGVLFTNCYVSAPSCCPSRGSVLTGQAFWRLEEGCMNHRMMRNTFRVYPDCLEAEGYHIGYTGKGWGPGNAAAGGWQRNPAGPAYNARKCDMPAGMSRTDYAANFEEFLEGRPEGKPFCFWYGSNEPHRAYEKGMGVESGKRLEDATVPCFLPDSPEVRGDILDYYVEIERFDRDLGRMLEALERRGEIENTLIVVTSDNGMPFPRAKAQLYDYGTRMPLAICWPESVSAGRTVADFISFTDFAPTFLEAAGLTPLPEMTGRSFLGLLTSGRSGQVDTSRHRAFFGKERHHPQSFEDGLRYASRAVRTHGFLYIRNYRPDRPASGSPPAYADTDGSPSKSYMVENRERAAVSPLYELAFGKRPAEELYDLRSDPGQMTNVAPRGKYTRVLRRLREMLQEHLVETEDPRALGEGDVLDAYCTMEIPSPGGT